MIQRRPISYFLGGKHTFSHSPSLLQTQLCKLSSARSTMSSHAAPINGTDSCKKVTIQSIALMHQNANPITMITAHDYPSAQFVDRAGADILLVGDSLGMVVLGLPSTVSITMDEMIHHCKAVSRGAHTPFLVADMPFGSYESCSKAAITNACRFIKEAGMEAVKLEGGQDSAHIVKDIVRAGIPVMGHIGLTPQRMSMLGGFRVQGKSLDQAKLLIKDALALQSAGCFAVVLEAIPAPVATYITEHLSIPTIGIGAGVGCSGQVLVQQDMLGLFDGFVPKFCKRYANLSSLAINGLQEYCTQVKARSFPAPEHTYPMPPDQEKKFNEQVRHKKINCTST